MQLMHMIERGDVPTDKNGRIPSFRKALKMPYASVLSLDISAAMSGGLKGVVTWQRVTQLFTLEAISSHILSRGS